MSPAVEMPFTSRPISRHSAGALIGGDAGKTPSVMQNRTSLIHPSFLSQHQSSKIKLIFISLLFPAVVLSIFLLSLRLQILQRQGEVKNIDSIPTPTCWKGNKSRTEVFRGAKHGGDDIWAAGLKSELKGETKNVVKRHKETLSDVILGEERRGDFPLSGRLFKQKRWRCFKSRRIRREMEISFSTKKSENNSERSSSCSRRRQLIINLLQHHRQDRDLLWWWC